MLPNRLGGRFSGAITENALGCVKDLIASIKVMREHPLVQEFRERGFDPEGVELLRVGHEKFGYRWVLLDENRIVRAPRHSRNLLSANLGVVDTLEDARIVILRTAPQFAADSAFLQLPDDHDGEEGAIQLLYDAAAFLLRCGIVNVDQDTTEANFGLPNSEMISPPPTLH